MRLTLENGQAIEMGSKATLEDAVAIKQKMLRGDGGSDRPVGLAHVIGSLFGRDVLKDDSQSRELRPQGDQHVLNKTCLSIEDIDLMIGHFAMHAESNAICLHRL